MVIYLFASVHMRRNANWFTIYGYRHFVKTQMNNINHQPTRTQYCFGFLKLLTKKYFVIYRLKYKKTLNLLVFY